MFPPFGHGEELRWYSRVRSPKLDLMTTFHITLRITTGPRLARDLQTPQQIEDEIRSWLAGLGAAVGAVLVKELP